MANHVGHDMEAKKETVLHTFFALYYCKHGNKFVYIEELNNLITITAIKNSRDAYRTIKKHSLMNIHTVYSAHSSIATNF